MKIKDILEKLSINSECKVVLNYKCIFNFNKKLKENDKLFINYENNYVDVWDYIFKENKLQLSFHNEN